MFSRKPQECGKKESRKDEPVSSKCVDKSFCVLPCTHKYIFLKIAIRSSGTSSRGTYHICVTKAIAWRDKKAQPQRVMLHLIRDQLKEPNSALCVDTTQRTGTILRRRLQRQSMHGQNRHPMCLTLAGLARLGLCGLAAHTWTALRRRTMWR